MFRFLRRRPKRDTPSLPTKLDLEVREEIRFYLEMRTRELIDEGLSPDEARRTAIAAFGEPESVAATCVAMDSRAVRSTKSQELLHGTLQDLRHALRCLGKSPGFTIVAVLTLALGIGANIATFSLINSVVLHPFPFEGGDRLVQVWRFGEQLGSFIDLTPTPEMVDAWSDQARSLDAIMAYGEEEFFFTGGDEPERLQGVDVSPEMFSLLGVRPILGRSFTVDDGRLEHERVVLLSEGFWRRRFGSDSSIVGRSVILDETPHTVVGVLPTAAVRTLEAALFYGDPKAVWVPMRDGVRHTWNTAPYILGRLAPSIEISEAQEELELIQSGLEESGVMEAGWRPLLLSPHDAMDGNLRTGLWIVFGAVGFVMLIACANLANMLLARGVARGHEFAIRAALGAGRSRIVRQVLTESLMLSVLGGTVGVVLGIWGVDAVVGLVGSELGELRSARVDPIVFAFTVALTLGTGLAFGIVPAVRVRRLSNQGALLQGRRGDASPSGRSVLRQSLIAGEVLLAVVLATGAGLMVKSFIRLNQVDPGFDPDGLVTMQLTLSSVRYPDMEQRAAFFANVAERVRQLPSVESVSWARGMPPRLPALFGMVEIDGEGPDDAQGSPVLTGNWVSADYFQTVATRIVEGRSFVEGDAGEAVVVNEALARRYWPNGSPLGKRVRLESQYRSVDWRTIVGVAENVKTFWLGDDPNRMQMLFPYADANSVRGTIIARSYGDPDLLMPLLKEQVWAIDPGLPVDEVAVAETVLAATIARPRFNTLLLSFLAGLALLLAAIGVYGVIALSVTQRTREIGLRMALGAQRTDILRLMVGHGLRPIVIGMVAGLAASIGLTRLLESLLFEVQPTDATTYVLTIASLAIVGVTACYVPARRGMKVDPMEALRVE
jgi:putative ABC transport system permease protein